MLQRVIVETRRIIDVLFTVLLENRIINSMEYANTSDWGRYVAPVFEKADDTHITPFVKSLRDVFIIEFEQLYRRPFSNELLNKTLSLQPYPDLQYNKCIGPVFTRNIFVPCHKCFNCLKAQGLKLFNLFKLESTRCKFVFFVTLTYSSLSFETLNVRTTQLFFKRLRYLGYQFSYRLLAEHGPTHGRPHYHILLFLRSDIDSFDSFKSDIFKCWPLGLVDVASAQEEHLYYIANYGKQLFTSSPTFSTSSKRPSIGKSTGLRELQISEYAETGSYTSFNDTTVESAFPYDELEKSFDYTEDFLEQKKDITISDMKSLPPPLTHEILCNHFYRISEAYKKFLYKKIL